METYTKTQSKSTRLFNELKQFGVRKVQLSISDQKIVDSFDLESSFSNTPLDNTPPFSQLDVYEGIIRVKELFAEERHSTPPERTPGDIKDFSQGARSRAFKWLLTLNTSDLSEAIFITLTYHNEDTFEVGKCKEHLQKFFRQLKNHFPEIVYIWRLELQKRGQPHFHIILWSKHTHVKLYSEAVRLQLTKDWLECKSCKCKFCELYSVNVKSVTNRRHAIAYLSKYCAKVTDSMHESNLGKFWGTSFDAPRKPISEIYLTKCQHDKLKALLKKYLLDRKINLPMCLSDEAFNESFSMFIDIAEFIDLIKSESFVT